MLLPRILKKHRISGVFFMGHECWISGRAFEWFNSVIIANALLLISISTGARCRLDRSLRDPSPALPNASMHGMGGLGLAAGSVQLR